MYDQKDIDKTLFLVPQIDAENKKIKAEFDSRADYTVEIGSTPSGTWEKWASGKLVQRGVTLFNVTYVVSGQMFYAAVNPAGTEAVKFHMPFAGPLATLCIVDGYSSNNCTGVSNNVIKLTGIQVLYFYNSTAASNQEVRYSWEATGRWK